jgi:hypothetical protein
MGDMDLVGTSYQFSAVSRVTSRARNERAFRQCVGQKGLTRKGTTSSRGVKRSYVTRLLPLRATRLVFVNQRAFALTRRQTEI